MSSRLYKINKLKWSKNIPDENGDRFLSASTPFGSYRIEVLDGVCKWGYCFDEYYDEEMFECESIREGKANAMKHWVERLSSALTVVEG